jgi:hypothetical protein
MGLWRALGVACAIGAVACGGFLGFGDDDEPPPAAAPPAVASRAPDAPDGDTTVILDAGAPDTASAVTPDAGKIVFLSSKTTLPTFDGGGVDSADAFCEALAKAAGITNRTFRAYVFAGGGFRPNDGTSDDGWFLRDGRKAFAGPGLGATPLVALDVDENGSKPDASARVWIGGAAVSVNLGGILGVQLVSKSCDGWTSTGGDSIVGDARNANAWKDDGEGPCKTPRHVYCVER